MTDYVVSGGRSSTYPAKHYGGQFIGNRATFCLDQDFLTFDANVQAIPNLQVSQLTSLPVTANDKFFGMHVKYRINDSQSGCSFGTVRSHDMENGKGRWQFIQPTNDPNPANWDWADLDSWANTHYAAGRDLVFTLFGTPAWASARPTERNAYSDQDPEVIQYNRGITSEPLDMTKWDAFCAAVATRYLGKIKYYEVWNEPNYQNDGTGATGTYNFFSGTYAKLAEMVRRANQAIKAIDPTAKIICPATTVWAATAGSADTYFTGMMSAPTSDGSTTMKDWIDIVGVHLYLPTPNRMQDLFAMIDRVNASKTAAGVSALPTWDTESAPINPEASTLTDLHLSQFIARSMIIQAAKGIARTFYFQYDGPDIGIKGRPAVSYRERIASLLLGGSIQSVSSFSDGRVGYYTSSGLTII